MQRRKFIRNTGLGGLGLILPNIHLSKPKKSLGVALVGLGYYSTQLLAPALQLTKHCHLAGIVTGSPEKIPVWQKGYNIPDTNVYNYSNIDKVSDNPNIDVVYIVLPNSMHMEYAIKASEAGKSVWCEKPMAVTVNECQQIISVCKKNKSFLSIGYRMQHEPNTQTIMEWGKSKPFGKIQNIKTKSGWKNNNNGEDWKLKTAMGGGVIYDMGVYNINAARYVTNEDPISVTARHETSRTELNWEVPETTIFDLRFPSGAIANCETSFGVNQNSLHVQCTKGHYHLKPFQAYNGIQGTASDGTVLNQLIENEQATQMENDALAILNSKGPLVPGEEGLIDVRVVEAILASARTGKSVQI